ncbi:hypothetical protein KPH14_010103 [Odynerus spinipes]|uniref:PDZ domain-containing protein n=1 Tax=Odynerus spinipes TaxID=1348599 RepID=A0AAD9VTD6_9HYME|nr:hypothetical protein KPH14_010103 [Odynerus spinipes]
MTRKQTLIIKLKRSSTGRPWGIRIAGGADLASPIVVTRSENEELQRGDVIKKIDDYDARDVRHVDAQNLLQNSERIKLVVERAKPARKPGELPKSPVPPPLFDEYDSYEPPPVSSERFQPPHEHLDEVREERANLSQVPQVDTR